MKHSSLRLQNIMFRYVAYVKNFLTHPDSKINTLFYTGSHLPFESSSRSVCWSTSRFMGPCLVICATTVMINKTIRQCGKDLGGLHVYTLKDILIPIYGLGGNCLGLYATRQQQCVWVFD